MLSFVLGISITINIVLVIAIIIYLNTRTFNHKNFSDNFKINDFSNDDIVDKECANDFFNDDDNFSLSSISRSLKK